MASLRMAMSFIFRHKHFDWRYKQPSAQTAQGHQTQT